MGKRNTYVINEGMSVKYLADQLDISLETATKVIAVCCENIEPVRVCDANQWAKWFAQFHHPPTKLMRQFYALNHLLETHGSEIVCEEGRTSPQRMDGSDILLEYCNAGDTYILTVAYEHRRHRWVLTSWGDWMERHPRLTRDPNGE